MKKTASSYPRLAIAAFAVGLAVLVWTGFTARALLSARSRIQRQMDDLDKILMLEADLLRTEPWLEAIQRDHAKPLGDPVEPLNRIAPSLPPPRIRILPQEDRTDGLRVVQMELEFQEIPVAVFGTWLNACEAMSPPWRATRVLVDIPGGNSMGNARAEVTLEGVQAPTP